MSLSPELAAELSDYSHGRVPRALRERQVLELAEELFAEQGYAGASMDELARRAGVSKPVVYALVESKEELYRRCVERMSEELAACIAEAASSATDPAEQLRMGIEAFFVFVHGHRRLWEALAWESTPFATAAARVRQRQTQLVASLLASNALRLGADVEPRRIDATAQLLNGAMEALARWWGSHQDIPAEQLSEWAVALVLPGLQQIVAESTAGRIADTKEAGA